MTDNIAPPTSGGRANVNLLSALPFLPPAHGRLRLHVPGSLGERAADAATSFAGSWRFLGLHALWFAAWIVGHVEAYPYGLLTMIVSLEAIFLSTLVMLSQNRQATKDRSRDDLEAREVDELFRINQQQLEILRALHQLRTGQRARDPKQEVNDNG